MSYTLSFHPLVQQDLNEILAYDELQATLEIAHRFEAEFRAAAASIHAHPRHFPFYQGQRRFRRCRLRIGSLIFDPSLLGATARSQAQIRNQKS